MRRCAGADPISRVASAFICYEHFKTYYEYILFSNSEEVRTDEEAEPSSRRCLTHDRWIREEGLVRIVGRDAGGVGLEAGDFGQLLLSQYQRQVGGRAARSRHGARGGDVDA